MSVRSRKIGQRLARDLEKERSSHALTETLLRTNQATARGFRAELDQMRNQQHDLIMQRHRLMEMAADVAGYFTVPPKPLTRDSELFRFLEEILPHKIPATPEEMLRSVLETASANLMDAVPGLQSWMKTISQVVEDDGVGSVEPFPGESDGSTVDSA